MSELVRRGSRRLYNLSERTLKINRRLFGDSFRCQYCGEKFEVGDVIYSVYNKNVKWYHKKCYELTLYDG